MNRETCELLALRRVIAAASEGTSPGELVTQVSEVLQELKCEWVEGPPPSGALAVGPEEERLGGWVVDQADPADLETIERIVNAVDCALEHGGLALRAQAMERRFRNLVESIPYAVYELNEGGELTYLSAKVEELTGYAPAALLRGDPSLDDLIVPEDRERVEAARSELRVSGDQLSVEFRLLRGDGAISWIQDHATASPSEGGLGRVGVLVDRREAKRLEAQVLAQSRLATLGELAAGVAHEVNNPLSGVLNYAQLARRLAPEHEKLGEVLAGILSEGKRIQSITQSLLTFSRRPDDESFRPLRPAELVRASLTIMRRQLREEFVTLAVDVPQELPPLQARGQELQQVLQNLLVNARYALNKRFPRRDPEKVLEVRGRYREEPWHGNELGAIELVIRDCGVGIDPSVQNRLFLPFFTTRAEGTGLGLSVSRDIVARHDGEISVESELGSGTTFRVTIPVFGG